MTCKIYNLTHRIVSIRGNSGQTWHLPPNVSVDVLDAEVTHNAKITKLAGKGIIAVQQAEQAERASKVPERGRRPRSQSEGIGE
jgi:hypothetical protein